MLNSVRVVGVAALLSLAGCDSGTEDTDETYQPERLPGEFRDSRITRNFYPDARWATGSEGASCATENAYLETRNGRVRVYGSTAYSETTFRLTANEIDSRIDKVLSYFEYRWRDFVYERPSNTPYPRQVIACLNNVLTHGGFAVGSLSGITVAPYHNEWPGDAGTLLDNALYAFVIENMAGTVNYASSPAWLTEGQAASASGLDAIEPYRHYDQNPLTEVSPSIEHSVLAYDYLVAANGVDAVTVLWLALREKEGDAGFRNVFDASNLQDQAGVPLSYERFIRDYHDLINATY